MYVPHRYSLLRTSRFPFLTLTFFATVFSPASWAPTSSAQGLDKQKLLDAQSFWDNRDWDWYQANIPFLDTPDAEINATYYYRWEVVTKHLTYGSPKSGYAYTEFIDRPFWSGAYGAISCPAGHQLYEVRWLRASAVRAETTHATGSARRAHNRGDTAPGWRTRSGPCTWFRAIHRSPSICCRTCGKTTKPGRLRHYVADVGLFWQTGHDDGMEYNINSRQTQDILRGAPGYRPTFNAYMYADALAIARIARLAGEVETAAKYEAKAAEIKRLVQEKLWDPDRQFFFPMFQHDEAAGRPCEPGGLVDLPDRQVCRKPARSRVDWLCTLAIPPS